MTTRFLAGNSDQPRMLTLVRDEQHPDVWFDKLLADVRSDPRIRVMNEPYLCTRGGVFVEWNGWDSSSEHAARNDLFYVGLKLRFYTPQEAFAFKMKYG